MKHTPLELQELIKSAGEKLTLIVEPTKKNTFYRVLETLLRNSASASKHFHVILLVRQYPLLSRKNSQRLQKRRLIANRLILDSLLASHSNFSYEERFLETELLAFRKAVRRPNKILLTHSSLWYATQSNAMNFLWIAEFENMPKIRLFFLKVRCAVAFLSVFWTLEKLNSEKKFETIFFLGGRNPETAAIREFAERERVKFFSVDKTIPRNKNFHLQSFQTHEQSLGRVFFEKWKQSFGFDELEELIKIGLRRLQKLRYAEHNKFTKRFNNEVAPKYDSDNLNFKKLVPIFNSSIEERFSNIGVDYNGWKNQPHAFDTVVTFLVQNGFTPYLRIHPNYYHKNLKSLCRFVAIARKHRISFALPWDNVNSYELIELSELVITWASSLCIDATYESKPTFNLGRTTYDDLLDVKVLRPDNLNLILQYKSHSVEPQKSAIVSGMLELNGFKFDNRIVDELPAKHYSSIQYRAKTRILAAKRLVLGGWNCSSADIKTLLSPFFSERLILNFLTKIVVVFSIVLYGRPGSKIY